MSEDPRNHLYKYYVEFLKRYKPKMFVFENVPGILSANNGGYLELIFEAVREAGYELDKKVLNAKHFGVIQDRKRVIIIGWKKNLKFKYPNFEENEPQFEILKDLFSDLPKIKNGQGEWGIVKYAKETNNYLEKYSIRNGVEFTSQHIARPNNQNDLEIYKIAVNKWVKEKKRLNYDELPERLIRHNNTKTFKNRFQVVNHLGVSHTIVAHICADGHYYIHPDIKQNRSITVREAARIQSFPDDYFFEKSRTTAFKQIGNAVPVLMAEGIAKKIKEMICL
jgi:DNA (cytosine-5)-methyltransferase 1